MHTLIEKFSADSGSKKVTVTHLSFEDACCRCG